MPSPVKDQDTETKEEKAARHKKQRYKRAIARHRIEGKESIKDTKPAAQPTKPAAQTMKSAKETAQTNRPAKAVVRESANGSDSEKEEEEDDNAHWTQNKRIRKVGPGQGAAFFHNHNLSVDPPAQMDFLDGGEPLLSSKENKNDSINNNNNNNNSSPRVRFVPGVSDHTPRKRLPSTPRSFVKEPPPSPTEDYSVDNAGIENATTNAAKKNAFIKQVEFDHNLIRVLFLLVAGQAVISNIDSDNVRVYAGTIAFAIAALMMLFRTSPLT